MRPDWQERETADLAFVVVVFTIIMALLLLNTGGLT